MPNCHFTNAHFAFIRLNFTLNFLPFITVNEYKSSQLEGAEFSGPEEYVPQNINTWKMQDLKLK